MLKNAGIVSSFAVLAQLVGFLRTAIMAFLFGASGLVDAYYLALVVPILLSGIIGGWLQVAFVGRYMELCRQPGEASAEAFRSSIGRAILVIGVFASLTIFVARAPLTEILVPASRASARQLTELGIAVGAWSLLPTVLSDFLALILNCHGRFRVAALAPIINALVSALALWLWPKHNLDALLLTLMLGWFAQLFVMLFAFKRAGLRFIAQHPLVTDDIRGALRLALPVLPAVAFSNGTTAVIQMACSRLGEGAVALYGYASRLHGALTQVMIVGISTVLLPHLADLLAERKHEEIIHLFWRIGRVTLLIFAFVLSGVILLGGETIATIFGHGRFDSVMGTDAANAWSILTLSLFPFALSTFFAKLFQAMQQPVLLSLSSLISLLVTSLACYVGQATIGLNGIVAAPLVAQIFVLMFFLICFKVRFHVSGLFPNWIRTLFVGCAVIAPSVAAELALGWYFYGQGGALVFGLRATVFAGIFLLTVKVSGVSKWVLREDTA